MHLLRCSNRALDAAAAVGVLGVAADLVAADPAELPGPV